MLYFIPSFTKTKCIKADKPKLNFSLKTHWQICRWHTLGKESFLWSFGLYSTEEHWLVRERIWTGVLVFHPLVDISFLIPGILFHLVPPPTVMDGNSRKVLSVILCFPWRHRTSLSWFMFKLVNYSKQASNFNLNISEGREHPAILG